MNAMNEQTRAAVEEVRRTDCEFLTVPQVAKILKVNKNRVRPYQKRLLEVNQAGMPQGICSGAGRVH